MAFFRRSIISRWTNRTESQEHVYVDNILPQTAEPQTQEPQTEDVSTHVALTKAPPRPASVPQVPLSHAPQPPGPSRGSELLDETVIYDDILQ